MEHYFRNLNLIQIITKWRLHLGAILLITIVLSVIFSGPAFIKPRFKSTAVLYPSNISEYSDESLTEQMLQIMQSNDIRDSIISQFSLIDHYKIDTSDRYWKSALYWTYSRNIKITKTQYEAVQIEVFDIDPNIACDIVNAIISTYNRKIARLHNEKFDEVVAMYERHLRRKEKLMDSLQTRLRDLGVNYGLLNFETQTQEVAKGYLRTVQGGGGNINTTEVTRIKKNMEEKGGELIVLTELIEQEAANYASIVKDYDRAYMDHDRQFTYSNIVSHPEPADKKSTPVRWLIVFLSSIGVFFLSVIVIGVVENARPVSPKS